MIAADPMHNRPWQWDAACAGTDSAVFDTVAAVRTVPDDAALLCARCPVAAQCLDLAMRAEGGTSAQWRYGIFAGTSPDQRAKAWPKWAAEHGISPHAYRTDLAPCGTAAAHRRHLRNGEPIDALCAEWNQRNQQAKRTKPQGPPECGTRRGYRRHRRNGEDACPACKAANAAADRRLATSGTTTLTRKATAA